MSDTEFTYEDFLNVKPVSRETFSRLQDYVKLLKKWQKTINLISNSTLETLWQRHIIDSFQLIDYLSTEDQVIDLGSGAGLPGIILAIAGIRKITLIESDVRKGTFLREAARITNSEITILNQRVENCSCPNGAVITARAFAPLNSLFLLLSNTLNISHKLLLLKGKNYISEIEEARAHWNFAHEVSPSLTDKEAVILAVSQISPKMHQPSNQLRKPL